MLHELQADRRTVYVVEQKDGFNFQFVPAGEFIFDATPEFERSRMGFRPPRPERRSRPRR